MTQRVSRATIVPPPLPTLAEARELMQFSGTRLLETRRVRPETMADRLIAKGFIKMCFWVCGEEEYGLTPQGLAMVKYLLGVV